MRYFIVGVLCVLMMGCSANSISMATQTLKDGKFKGTIELETGGRSRAVAVEGVEIGPDYGKLRATGEVDFSEEGEK